MEQQELTISKSAVDRAGETFRRWLIHGDVDPDKLSDAYETVSRYRDMHAYPMRKVTGGVSHYIKTVRGDGSIRAGQRFKRMDRIINKLGRLTTRLSQMEDIGGCRAVLENVDQVYAVGNLIMERKTVARVGQPWRNVATIDYIANPKASGYRALHLIEERDGRLIEIQLRTPMQHRWAEAVETWVRPAVPFNLKDGGGPEAVKEYFRLAAAQITLVERGEKPDDTVERRMGALRVELDKYLRR